MRRASRSFPFPTISPEQDLEDTSKYTWRILGGYNKHNEEAEIDYEGRLKDSFFKYIKRTKNYDRNEVPWDGERGSKPVQVQMSAYLRKVLYTKTL